MTQDKPDEPDATKQTTDAPPPISAPGPLTRASLANALRNDPRLATLTPQTRLFVNLTLLIGVSLFFGVTSWNFLRLNNTSALRDPSKPLPFLDAPTLILFAISLASLLVWLYAHWRFVWARGDLRKMRWMQWTLLELLLILMTFGSMLNLFGFNYYSRFDISDRRANSLQPETLQVIKDLRAAPNPARVVFLMRRTREQDRGKRQFDVARHTERMQYLLNEFNAEAERLAPGQLVITSIDLEYEPERTAELAGELGLTSLQSDWAFGLLIMSGNVSKTGTMNNPDWMVITTGDMYQPISGKRDAAFTGEDSLTSGLQTVMLGKMETCWYVRGYGEQGLNRLPELSSAFAGANLLAQSVRLSDAATIPAEVKMVFVCGPNFPLSDDDVDKLIAYYRNGGNIFVSVRPAARGDTKLNRLLAVCGLKALETQPVIYGIYKDNVLIQRESQTMQPDSTGFINSFGQPLYGSNDTGRIENVFGAAVPVIPLSLSASDSSSDFQKMPLFRTLENKASEDGRLARRIWANDRIGDPRPSPADNNSDIQGPLTTAFAAYRFTDSPLGDGKTIVRHKTSRAIVLGDAGIIDSPEIARQSGNVLFLQQAVKWVAGSPRTIGVSTRIRERYRVPPDKLTDSHYVVLFALYAIAPAGLAIVAGIVVSLRRKRIGQTAAIDDAFGG
ncbi:MAG: Gldg family protein [Planctomycetota bacterium]